MVLTEAIGPHIVHIETQPMAGAVHVEVAIGPLLDHPIQRADQQTQVKQARHQDP